MKFEVLRKIIENCEDIYFLSMKGAIQPLTSKIEGLTEVLNDKGLDGNEEIIKKFITESAKLIKNLREFGVIE